jgi:hypothetical protein
MYLPSYLKNNLITEIIITDETGSDAQNIMQAYPNEPKLKVSVNTSVLGPYLNKLQACRKATNEWIALIDSDNFADDIYFDTVWAYIQKNTFLHKAIILSPVHSSPHPNLYHKAFEDSIIRKHDTAPEHIVMMNTGNYVINKYLIDNLITEPDYHLIEKSHACDVLFMNTMMFEQFSDLEFHVIKDLKYLHNVHSGSIYTIMNNRYPHEKNTIFERYQHLK